VVDADRWITAAEWESSAAGLGRTWAKCRRQAPRGSARRAAARDKAQSVDCHHHAPHLHRSQIRWCPALCVVIRLPAAAISGLSRQEFPTMVALEPQAAGHSSLVPIYDEFPLNPFVMTFEAEGNETLAFAFRLAIRKSAPILDFSTQQRRQYGPDDGRKTLTQRADYSQMTAKNGSKIRRIKQRTK
jgi:hypothetical protein